MEVVRGIVQASEDIEVADIRIAWEVGRCRVFVGENVGSQHTVPRVKDPEEDNMAVVVDIAGEEDNRTAAGEDIVGNHNHGCNPDTQT